MRKEHEALTIDNIEKGKELFRTKPIPKTPFTLMERENQYHIMWGEYMLTQLFETEEEALNYLESNTWDIIGVFCISILHKFDKQKDSKNDD